MYQLIIFFATLSTIQAGYGLRAARDAGIFVHQIVQSLLASVHCMARCTVPAGRCL